jgi:hypothetical protein
MKEKRRLWVMDLVASLGISIAAILFGLNSNFSGAFMGNFINQSDKIHGLIVTLVFLVVWLFYGKAKGFKKDKGFLIFNSLYWGIGGLISLITIAMAPIGKFAIIVIPIDILLTVPTFGLTCFYMVSSNTEYLVPIVSMIASWLAGSIGYLLGYLLNKFRAAHTETI